MSFGDSLVSDSWEVANGVSMSILQNPVRTRVHATGKGEHFSVPPHWHIAHDERHVIIKGRIKITQDGVTRIIGPEDGVSFTGRRVVHSIEGFPGEELIIEETSTETELTEQKILLFRSMFHDGILQSPLAIMQVFYYGDSYPVFAFGFRWLEVPVVIILGRWVAPSLGYKLPDSRLRLDPVRFPRDKKD
ncbi:putative cupintype [Favolaschia claudopus]|uniref:Cupintype n=1 Tax=Favolaschia claudopus TaxID=2862362 RepID=A0AAW0ECV0_9AGAR